MRTVFIGPNGIRAGWRFAIFVLLFAAIVFVLFSLMGVGMHFAGMNLRTLMASAGTGALSPITDVVPEGTFLIAALLAAWIMSRIERRPVGVFGLPLAQAFRGKFWEGAFVGFVAISLVLFAIFAIGDFRITGFREAGGTLVTDAFEWAVAFVIVGLSEEFLFRGYVQFTLTTGTRFWIAALITSALFALAHTHNHGETVVGIADVAVFGLVFALVLWRTGNLWFGVGFHFAWDWAETYFYGVPDSGFVTPHALFATAYSGPSWLSGSTAGPEGSIFTLVVLVLVAVYAWFRFKGEPYPWRSVAAVRPVAVAA